MYIILNLAIGANFIELPDSTTPFPSNMSIDYLRVWQKQTVISTPTPTNTSTSVPATINPNCLCTANGITNLCNNSCTTTSGNNNSGFSCKRESGLGSVPSSTDMQNYCTRDLRSKGDADGLNGADPTDYLYYVRVVNGGSVPSWVNTDFDGNGATTRSDRDIVIANIK